MKKTFLILIVFASFVVETKVSVFGMRPNLTMLIAYYFGLRHGQNKGLLFGAVVGAVGDSLSGNILGPNILAKGAVGYLSPVLTASFFMWSRMLGVVMVFFLTAIDGVMEFAALAFFAEMPTGASNAALIVVLQALLNSAAGAFLKPAEKQVYK